MKSKLITLFSATMLAQLITLLTSPIISRIYSPSDFGVYTIYLTIVALLIIFITGRFEFLINTLTNYYSAVNAYYLTIICTLITSLLLFPFFMSMFLFFNYDFWGLEEKVFLVPLTLVAMGFVQAINYLLNRYDLIRIISKYKLLQSLTNNSSALILGIMNFTAIGLMLSNITGLLISFIYSRFNVITKNTINFHKIEIKKIKELAVENKEYPFINSFSAFFDMLALQAPVLLFSFYYTKENIGFYGFAIRVFSMPISIMSTTISQVFLSEISNKIRKKESYYSLIIKTILLMSIVALIPFIVMGLYGPSIFSFIFGEEWKTAGKVAAILSIGYYFKFVISPLGMIFFAEKKIKLLFKIQVFRSISTIIILIIGVNHLEFLDLLIFYSIHEAIFYLIYCMILLKLSSR